MTFGERNIVIVGAIWIVIVAILLYAVFKPQPQET